MLPARRRCEVGTGARFGLGLLLGFAAGTAVLQLALWSAQPAPGVMQAWRGALAGLWATVGHNLRGSIYLFLLVLVFYLRQLTVLRALLSRPEPAVEQVLRREQLLDLCANLFFGIGVIWTAIGMRGALLYALGDSEGVGAGSGSAMLQRLVEGGILLALSTTIVGGTGGYLMRTGKYLLCGEALSALYLHESARPAQQGLDALQRIESALAVTEPPPGAAEKQP